MWFTCLPGANAVVVAARAAAGHQRMVEATRDQPRIHIVTGLALVSGLGMWFHVLARRERRRCGSRAADWSPANGRNRPGSTRYSRRGRSRRYRGWECDPRACPARIRRCGSSRSRWSPANGRSHPGSTTNSRRGRSRTYAGNVVPGLGECVDAVPVGLALEDRTICHCGSSAPGNCPC